MIKATTAEGQVIENTYNFKGMRSSKTVDGVKTDFYYDGKTLIAEVTDKGAIRNINGVNLLARQGQDTLYNGHADVVAIVNGEGVITNQYDYDVFGNLILSSEGFSNTSKYSGYYYDKETGYYYLQSRYYDPEIARFITEDTYKGQYSDPLSLNLYTYCNNNSVMLYDPDGNFGILAAIGIGMAIGFLSQVVADMATNVVTDMTTNNKSFGDAFKNGDNYKVWEEGKHSSVGIYAGSIVSGAILGGVGKAAQGISTANKLAKTATGVVGASAIDSVSSNTVKMGVNSLLYEEQDRDIKNVTDYGDAVKDTFVANVATGMVLDFGGKALSLGAKSLGNKVNIMYT